jgi:catecholate siderophore receptor
MASERQNFTLRPLISGAAATAGLALTGTSLATPAQAQSTAAAGGNAQATQNDVTVLNKITVEGEGGDTSNTNNVSTGIARLPGTIKETPKIVNVVPREIIEQQRATTIEQALRNVPGITLSTGEGNGGQNGSQFRIRGLQARSDIYVDGLKDFGVYTRDTFNVDSVQVLKGPAGDNFGAGNTGGLINQSAKKARLGTSTSIDQGIGSGMTYRTTVDSNIQIDDTTAVRFNGLFHKQDVADRDHIEAGRRGLAVDLGMGLGTDTEWHLNYTYLHGNGTPDYGQPTVLGADGISLPAAEFGFDPSISYARSVNRDVTNSHMLSSYLNSEVNDWLTLSNDTRLTFYDRDFGGTTTGSCTGACATNFFAVLNGGGNPNATYILGAGGGMTYLQDGWAFQNVSTAKMDFETGSLRHKLNVGLDVSYQNDKRVNGSWPGWANRNIESVFNPRYDYGFVPAYDFAAERTFKTTDIGVFVNDRVYLTDQFSILGGLRFDHFRTEQEQSGIRASRSDNALNPSLALIWEPMPEYSFYASYARTSKPNTADIAALTGENVTTPISPEDSQVYEIGAKADLLDGRLGLTGAIFQVDKDNSVNEDTSLPGGSGDGPTGRRVRGVEIGVSGKITDAWSVFANYAYLHGEITASSVAAEVGMDAPYVPEHNFNVWTSYTIAEDLSDALPGKFTIGGGVQVASAYWLNNANTQKIPRTFSLDAVAAYEHNNFRVSLNGYNLTDHQNYQSGFSNRAVPASGRTFMLNVGSTF